MKVIRDRPRSVDIDDFLARPLFAHLATASPAGPRDSPVWFLWEDDCIWIIGSRTTDSFPARVEREQSCAIGVVDFDLTAGLVQHVGLRGRAALVPFDPARAHRLLCRYLGPNMVTWDDRFRATLEDAASVLVRFEPETVVARDVSYRAGLSP
jgi:Pyridoxamine 5'-phosphate oxidase